MREIKFRFWDKENKVITLGYSIEELQKVAISEFLDVEGKYEVEVMQYTGLKDKNGVEIYEGDIVKIQRSKYPENDYALSNGVIEWCSSCCMGYRVQFIGIGNNERLSAFEQVEVIGNIYQNKELLK